MKLIAKSGDVFLVQTKEVGLFQIGFVVDVTEARVLGGKVNLTSVLRSGYWEPVDDVSEDLMDEVLSIAKEAA